MSDRPTNRLRNPFRSSDGQAILVSGFLLSARTTPHSTRAFDPSSLPVTNSPPPTSSPGSPQHSSANRVRPRSGSEDTPSNLFTLKEEDEPTKTHCRKALR
ncbi:hypothetical protein [Phaffia rhodozyma]|uniref:Uncharacterized protein n=1 Tax=Phaffia rhodozyma TaxID=264483 RepID=A0A0F7SQL5_PHARH|nr:hypothetical protein [Phaffia rhodozyma]